MAQQYSVSKINKKYTKRSQVRSPAREIFLKNQDFVPFANLSMVRTSVSRLGKYLPLGLFDQFSPNEAVSTLGFLLVFKGFKSGLM